MLSDLRFAARLLIKQPSFTLIAVLVLALGIGANTAIFSVIDAVLLRPLPYAEQERLVQVSNFWKRTGLRATISAPDFHDWHDQAKSFEGIAAYLRAETSVVVADAADYTVVTRATPDFFTILRARAEAGRPPPEAGRPDGGPLPAVVSHAFWAARMGSSPAAIGTPIRFAQRVFTVVGVLPPEFRFPAGTDVWTAWWVFPETTSRSA